MADRLDITFEGPRVDEAGVSLDDFRRALDNVQRALRLMAGHLAGLDPARGHPPESVREQSALRLRGTSRRSFVAELELAPPEGARLRQESHGRAALAAILAADGVDDPALPESVRECLSEAATGLSAEVAAVSLGDAGGKRRIRIARRPRGVRRRRAAETEPALVYGLLLEVNWENGTAQLHELTATPSAMSGSGSIPGRAATCCGWRRSTSRSGPRPVRRRRGLERSAGRGDRGHALHVGAVRQGCVPERSESQDLRPRQGHQGERAFDVDEFLRVIREGRNV